MSVHLLICFDHHSGGLQGSVSLQSLISLFPCSCLVMVIINKNNVVLWCIIIEINYRNYNRRL